MATLKETYSALPIETLEKGLKGGNLSEEKRAIVLEVLYEKTGKKYDLPEAPITAEKQSYCPSCKKVHPRSVGYCMTCGTALRKALDSMATEGKQETPPPIPSLKWLESMRQYLTDIPVAKNHGKALWGVVGLLVIAQVWQGWRCATQVRVA